MSSIICSPQRQSFCKTELTIIGPFHSLALIFAPVKGLSPRPADSSSPDTGSLPVSNNCFSCQEDGQARASPWPIASVSGSLSLVRNLLSFRVQHSMQRLDPALVLLECHPTCLGTVGFHCWIISHPAHPHFPYPTASKSSPYTLFPTSHLPTTSATPFITDYFKLICPGILLLW